MSIVLSNSSSRLRYRGGAPEDSFSCAGAFRLDSDPNDIQTLIALGGDGTGTDWHEANSIVVRTLADGVTLEVRAFGLQVIVGPALVVGEWTRIGLCGDATPGRDVRLFINGALYTGASTFISGLWKPEVIELGNSTAGQYFRGAIGGWKCWDITLDNDQMAKECCYIGSIYQPGLFQECDLPTLTDLALHSRNFETPSASSSSGDPPIDYIDDRDPIASFPSG